jgi:2-polyprenyl-3-methyl-5-hydroxy-6-metoxy-1,4-benzoquinol methylase
MENTVRDERSSGNSNAERLRALNDALAECFRKRNVIDVLEAGGGSKTHIEFGQEKNLTITTIDISSVQLDKNTYANNKILGDICKYKFTPESYDVIVCYDVIEHVDDPQAALRSFIGALKPGGCIVIGAPNPLSLKGLVTKFTPHLAHVLFYRIIHNNSDAGKPGYFPYPTTMKFFISPRNLANVCKRAGLEVVYLNIYESQVRDMLRKKSHFFGAALDMLLQALHFASAGRYAPELSDFHLIVKKPSANPSRIMRDAADQTSRR